MCRTSAVAIGWSDTDATTVGGVRKTRTTPAAYAASSACDSPAIISDDTITGTAHTSNTELAPGDYRYWVCAINAAVQNGAWSDPVRLTIVSLDNEQPQPSHDVLLASSVGASEWTSESVPRAVPVELFGDTEQELRSIATYADVPATV